MAILLGYETALAYWRECTSAKEGAYGRSGMGQQPAASKQLDAHHRLLGDSATRNNATKSAGSTLSQLKGRRASIVFLAQNPDQHLLVVEKQASSRRHRSLPHTISNLPPRSCMYAKHPYSPSETRIGTLSNATCEAAFGDADGMYDAALDTSFIMPDDAVRDASCGNGSSTTHGTACASLYGTVYVSTPEFCFLQMANELPLEQLIALGFELCGTYARHDERTIYGVLPLTSPNRIDCFLMNAKGMHGIKKARRALRYVIPNSASPMESILTMFLCLPYSLGGYGITPPKMNHRIDLPLKARRKARAPYFVCDLYWEKERLAIEYDSDLAHSGINRTLADAMRYDALTSVGISVMSVARPQITNARAFDQLAHLIAYKLHKRLRYVDPQFTRAHQRLRSLILFS